MNKQTQNIHIYPVEDEITHEIRLGAADCWCEPEVPNVYYDDDGKIACRIVIHQQLRKNKQKNNKEKLK